ncbi:alpha-keto acid decarboxylase family protein [Paractinoplanes maris]|uniref:alpha-keto acid decarboxylase family protein n=1 Tax=Paractinoplanes maris TaxID=1734446 RepID=UPI00202114D1|nr:thiamine pyrophosphate-binding protein [Actinoplanes maris]
MVTVTLAEYLGRRLVQCGVGHLFGVPGDFNLTLLDHLIPVDGLAWVGSPNELGAGYAADAYARSRGLAAIVTTYGVGELSALNAIAGSAAEDVPVVHIAGSPSTTAVAARRPVHHTLADGVFGRFANAYAEVTVHQEIVTAGRAAEQIDAVLLAAMTHRKPAYLSIPQDLATLPVDAAPLATPLTPVPRRPLEFEAALRERLRTATRPVIVAGHLVARFGLGAEVLAAATKAGIPIVTSLAAKGVIDESEPLHHGVYAGTMIDEAAARLVREADLVIELGTVASDVLSGFFTHRGPDEQVVHVGATTATIGLGEPRPVAFADAIRTLAAFDFVFETAARGEPTARRAAPDERTPGHAAPNKPTPAHAAPDKQTPGHAVVDERTTGHVAVDDDAALSQEALWAAVQDWLPGGIALLADTGTSFWGAAGLRLPPDTVFVGQPIWNSIGYALPAVLGQGLADPGRRPVLIAGDGAAQMTVQELSTIAAAALKPVVLLLNNDGYTIERALQSPDAGYNDVAAWDWAGLVTALTGDKVDYHRAETAADLRHALTAIGDAFTFIEVVLDKYDAPPLLRRLAERSGGGAPGTS